VLDLPRERWTFTHALRRQAAARGDETYCAFDDGRSLSYKTLDEQSNRLAAGLASLGIGPHDRVALIAPNSEEFLLTMHGVHKRRAVLVPISTELRGDFLTHQLSNCEPALVVVHADHLSTIAACWPSALTGGRTVVIGAGERPAYRDFSELLSAASVGDEAVLVPEGRDVALILYTSGTTGRSKGVLMPHAHCFLFGALFARALWLDANDRFLVTMPMFHVNALLMSLGACLISGMRAEVVKRFSASRWLADVRRSGATATNALGVMPEFILGQPPAPDDATHSLRRMMAVPISKQWGAAFEARFGVQLIQVYGMTECNIVSIGDRADPLQPGCAGPIVADHFDVAIRDPSSWERLPSGAIGEIVVRPHDPSCFMQGYFRMEAESAAAWRDGWFRTGDAGWMDERGRLHFVDRIRDTVRRRGENISSFEVEQVLNAHPDVAESAVVGVKVADAGDEDEVKAVLVAARVGVTPEELVEWCRPRMPRHAVPRFIEFVSALEKTPTGKVRKQALREAGVNAATWDREAVERARRPVDKGKP
jgi:crotonobetaine/carnitine-CoA ligase